MAEAPESLEEGSSRRTFLRQMAMAGLVGVPVVASFSLVGGCGKFPHGGGGNTTFPLP